jgi:hypothetical protein
VRTTFGRTSRSSQDHLSRLKSVSISALFLLSGLFTATGSAADLNSVLSPQRTQLTDQRTELEDRARSANSAETQAALATFLDRHRLPGSREAFLQWASLEHDPSRKQLALRQLVLDDALDGKTAQLDEDLRAYRAAGGSDLPGRTGRPQDLTVYSVTAIPGPLTSFARMAALSPDLQPEDLMLALARNIVMNGYQAVAANEALEPTEYLKLLIRYIGQARELEGMAGTARKIVIPSCDSAETAELLKILGYRMRGSCGTDVVLETVNPTKAFLTVDSGFPLSQLEQDLRANRRFDLPYAPTPIPVLYTPDYWLSAVGRPSGSFIDGFLSEPAICRLYLGLAKLDRPTAAAMRQQATAQKLKIYAHVLDFYGGMYEIRNGAAVVPGSPKAWESLVGVSPASGAAFFERLLTVDDGWMASYFDALARLDPNTPTARYLAEPERMKRFYYAIKGKVTTPGPARPVFRSSTELMLLTTGLRIDPDGQPHIPGNIEVWKTLFIKHPHGKYDGKLTRAASSWRTPDDVLEALFALCRKAVENEPLKIFLALNDVDRHRPHPISAQLAQRLANSYRISSSQYSIFAGLPLLSEESIDKYLDLDSAMNGIHDTLVRADALGSVQALVGLFQILCRQQAIAPEEQDATFSSVVDPFLKSEKAAEVFDAGRNGLNLLLKAAHASASGSTQDRVIDLLVGLPVPNSKPPSPGENFVRVFDAQRLIPFDTLFAVADRLGKASGDTKAIANLNTQLARFEDVQNLRSSLSNAEKNLLALGYWSERHVAQERKLNLDTLVKNSDRKDSRGAMLPFLRDTLVGCLYAYYAPPGAQLILTNPLFVRNHDFIGTQSLPMPWHSTEVAGSGWPASAGGRLMGSLTGLPYTLAEAEQNFLTPSREQALIWGDLVPQMIVNVTVPRWRFVSPEQMRFVALQMRRGEDLVAAAAIDPIVEGKVLASLGRFAPPARLEHVGDKLAAGDVPAALSQILPSELFGLASDPALRSVAPDLAAAEVSQLESSKQPSLEPTRISALFGTPKPTLTHSMQPELLSLRTFPTLMGYSSRVLAETWESNSLYYAELADELGVPTSELDSYVPDWTRATIENIFATHLEDWPALLHSLRVTGESIRQQPAARAAVNSGSY